MNVRLFLFLALGVFGVGFAARAGEPPLVLKMTIKDHKFDPAALEIPANRPVIIEITNMDPLAEEFDSPDLQIEKVIAGRSAGTVRLHALDAGVYKFTGEYHPETAQGIITVK